MLLVAGAAQPEAHYAEWNGRDALEPIALVDPSSERARERHVTRQRASQSLRAEVPQDHPQLQRAESPSELNARVHQVANACVSFSRLQIVRRQRKRLADDVH